MKEVLKYLFLAFTIVLLFIKCSEPDFYSYSKQGDVLRIPLIKPSEINSFSQGQTWFYHFPFQKISNCQNVEDVDRFGIKDSIIVIHSKRMYLSKYSKMTEVFAIVDMPNKREYVFDSEEDYIKELKKMNVFPITLYDVNVVYDDFSKNNKLPYRATSLSKLE